MTRTRESKTQFIRETEPGIGLYKYSPDDPDDQGQLRYMTGNPQGKTPGSAVSLHPWLLPIRTPERARELSLRGQEKKREAIEDGIREAVERGEKISLNSPSEALKYIAIAQTNLALDHKAGMPSVKAAELMLRAVDALPDPRYNFGTQAIQINLTVDGAQMEKFAKQEEILEGTFRDSDE